MTTGNVTYDDRVAATGGGWWGTYYSKVWNGGDRPKSTKSPHNYYETYREYFKAGILVKKTYRIRIPNPKSSENRKVKRSYDEEHDYSLVHQRRFEDRVSYTVPSNFSQWSDMTQHGATTWFAKSLFDANDQIRLIGKLKDKLDGSDFNLGVFLGELPDTVGLLGDTALRLGLALGSARRGQFGIAAEQLFKGTGRFQRKGFQNYSPSEWARRKNSKALADNWLELQYGWLPLLKDAEAAAIMLSHHLNVPMRQSYRVRIMRGEDPPPRITQVGYLPTQTATGKAEFRHTRVLIARVEEKGSIPQLLGLTNPELIAWELVPYSFVADWFIPIGQWMEARALVSRLKGTFIQCDKQTGVAKTPTSSYFAFKPRGNYFSVVYSRTVSTTIKVPMPTFKPLGKAASWQHCVNAVGLLVSGFAGRKD
jgi:hypothetical protein